MLQRVHPLRVAKGCQGKPLGGLAAQLVFLAIVLATSLVLVAAIARCSNVRDGRSRLWLMAGMIAGAAMMTACTCYRLTECTENMANQHPHLNSKK